MCPVCGGTWTTKKENYRNVTCSQSCGSAYASGTPWTASQLSNLRALYASYVGEKVPTAEIAKLLGKTPSAVKYKAHKLGLTEPTRPRAHNPVGNLKPATLYEKICPYCSCEFTVRAPAKTQNCCSRRCSSLLRIGTGVGGRAVKTHSGRRFDIDNIFFRSSWEANYARYLRFLQQRGKILSWEYEPKVFEFPVKRGNRTYTPDFRVTLLDKTIEWHEVKGWLDPTSQVKLKRFAKHFPDETLILIQKQEYREIWDAVGALIPMWEGSRP